MRGAVQVIAMAMACGWPGVTAAQDSGAPAVCTMLWTGLASALGAATPVTGTLTGAELSATDDPECVVEDLRVAPSGPYSPQVLADRLILRGAALTWLQDASTPPDRLDLWIEGLRFAVQTNNPQMDYLMAAQAKAGSISVLAALEWSADARILSLERLEIDFPGDNRISLTGQASGVDLSTKGAGQMSLTSFALTEADLTVQSHGLFESYVLMMIGPAALPLDGDMQAAEQALKAEAESTIAALPDAVVSPDSKAALRVLVDELPNPSGTLSLALRSKAGLGPARLVGYAMTGAPDSIADLSPLLDGLTLDIGWTHAPPP